MPTKKHRINLTIDNDLYSAFEILSKNRNASFSAIAIALIQRAMEIEEDIYFSEIADERLKRKETIIPHKKAWK